MRDCSNEYVNEYLCASNLYYVIQCKSDWQGMWLLASAGSQTNNNIGINLCARFKKWGWYKLREWNYYNIQIYFNYALLVSTVVASSNNQWYFTTT